jgi:predicted nucleic acid-binding protein
MPGFAGNFISTPIPAAVAEELTHAHTPTVVRAWLHSRPEWLEIREVPPSTDPTLAGLDPGERAAIQLAQQEHADLLLIDERLGVKAAQQRGLEVTGTLESSYKPPASTSSISMRPWTDCKLPVSATHRPSSN